MSTNEAVTTEAPTDKVSSTREKVTKEALTDEVLSTGKTFTTEAVTEELLSTSEALTTEFPTYEVLSTSKTITTEALIHEKALPTIDAVASEVTTEGEGALTTNETVTTKIITEEALSTGEVVTAEVTAGSALSTNEAMTTERSTVEASPRSEKVETLTSSEAIRYVFSRTTSPSTPLEDTTKFSVEMSSTPSTVAIATSSAVETVGLTDITQTSPDRPVTSSKPKTKATVVPIDDIDATDAIIGRFEGVPENTTKESPTKVKTHTFTTEVRCLHSVILSIVFR